MLGVDESIFESRLEESSDFESRLYNILEDSDVKTIE